MRTHTHAYTHTHVRTHTHTHTHVRTRMLLGRAQLDELNANGTAVAPKVFTLQRNAGATAGANANKINVTQPIRSFTDQVRGCVCINGCVVWVCVCAWAQGALYARATLRPTRRVHMPARPRR